MQLSVDIFNIVVIFISILLSMTLHEAMHAFTSHWLGDDTAKLQGRLSLNPLVHIDLFTTIILPLLLLVAGAPPFGAAKPVPFNPYRLRYGEFGAALVGAAGPLTNLFLAILGGLLLRFAELISPTASTILYDFTVVNLSFFLFNIIPFPPLDGSRILYAIAPDGVRTFMERIEAMGFNAIILFMFLFYFVLIGPFKVIFYALINLITGIGS